MARALSGICVDAIPAGAGAGGSASTAANGSYSIAGLPTGSYTVEFSTGCGNNGGYLSQWYNDETSQGAANAVSVTDGSTTSSINAAMVVAGIISGTVTAAAGGADLSGICVDASGPSSGSAVTASNGTYSITGLASGSYDVEFSSECGNTGEYASQWYNDETSQSSANPVSVTAGSITASIDAALAAGATVSGTVTASGAPLSNICVSVVGGPSSGDAVTTANGTYTISALETGSYDVSFDDCGSPGSYATQWYKGAATQAQGVAVHLTAGKTTEGISASMTPPPADGSISGTVTAAVGGTDLSGICVVSYAANGSGAGNATTASDGTYSITGMPPGSYDIEFSSACGNTGDYANQWYDGAVAESSATLVSVTAGSATTGIDAALALPGTITGTVTDSEGKALSDVCVYATSPGGAHDFDITGTASDGEYSLTGLAPGSYDVEFMARYCGNTTDLAYEWYDGASQQASATSVAVAAGATNKGIDAVMVKGGTISGKVSSKGAGATGVCVHVYPSGTTDEVGSAATTSDGTYSITGLATGSYDLEFVPDCGGTGTLASQWYSGSATESGATGVTVTAGALTKGANVTLLAGATITGTVTNGSGKGVGGTCVSADVAGTSTVLGSATTEADGTYSITALPADSYDVEFDSSCAGSITGTGFSAQWYNGATSETEATAVAVKSGKTAKAINATLS
jgi:uncharacterized protein YodC (DUF2158 family)